MIGRLFRSSFSSLLGDYPFECIMSVWGVVSGIGSLFNRPTSGSLQALPGPLQVAWHVGILLSAITIIIGLITKRYGTVVGEGLYLLAAILFAYSTAILGFNGWNRGGQSAGLILAVSIIAAVRGWHLKTRDRIIIETAAQEQE